MMQKDILSIHVLAKPIKLLIVDVDGVLTNGQLLYLESGEYKAFNARDGLGIAILLKSDIEVAVISGGQSNAVERRFQKFGITHIYQGVENKRMVYEQIKKELQLVDAQVAYIGDDLIDLPVMTQVGLATSPANADDFVKSYAHWVSAYDGGHGAVRELCELILTAQGKLDGARNYFLTQ